VASLPTGPFLNAEAIYRGLLAMGLTPNAAAGVAGNIYQESHGNPSIGSAAGGGLFGETIANSGSASGGSLAEQLSALSKYIAANGSVADINAHASSPQAAAVYFSDKYERPGIPALATREAAAEWVASAASSGNWGSGVTAAPAGVGGTNLLDFPSQITGFFSEADTLVTALMWITKPSNWVRVIAFLAGVALLLFAIHALIAVGEGGEIMPKMPNVVPVPI
jgi:Phage tail lysozyme